MPILNLKTSNKRKPEKRPCNGKSKEIYDNVYNTLKWRKLRDWKLQVQPLCERCLEEGRVTPATEVHHDIEISSGRDLTEMILLGFDPTNLVSLCHECHQKIHSERHKKQYNNERK